MAELGCGRVTGVVGSDTAQSDAQPNGSPKEVREVTATVGQQAPDFTAPAYHKGDFESVSLSDYAGRWVMLCFYPGDFTFV
jgi:peroxiredoxin (alkyl hydroperoxide reductase subunit C)